MSNEENREFDSKAQCLEFQVPPEFLKKLREVSARESSRRGALARSDLMRPARTSLFCHCGF
jgi:hypothetical protein